MAPQGDTFSFTIDEVGEASGKSFKWAFSAKKRLTVRERISQDQIRRNIIGERPQDAQPLTVLRAEMVAHLSVSITDSPKAWKDSNGGLDLCDDNILLKIYDEVINGQEAALKEKVEEVKEEKSQLRKVARSKKVEEEAVEKAEGNGGA